MNYAPYATFAEKSRGRLYKERDVSERTCFQRDRDRIIHSEAFRRLEAKTQVFVYQDGGSLRTRLTHSLEVSQLTRSLCRMLRLNQDLGEALALAHDLGHTPFGHAGETALNDCMKNYGGFDHNAHSLKVVTSLECKYPAFDGINLCWETLEGLAKHNGPLLKKGEDASKLPADIAEYNALFDLELDTYAGLEAQIASLADDIAYCNHDTDDGLKTEFIRVSQLAQVPFFMRHYTAVKAEYTGLDESRTAAETVRRMINEAILDVAKTSAERLAEINPQSVEEVRAFGEAIIGFSPQMRTQLKELKDFLFKNMYRHYKINQMTSKGRRILKDLFALFMDETNILPQYMQTRIAALENDSRREARKARLIADFIAGMTDASALSAHARLFDAQTRI